MPRLFAGERGGIKGHTVSLLAIGIICLGLAGCALAGLNNESAPATFDLVSPPVTTSTTRKAGWQLEVNEPQAVRALETDRILVKPGPDRITYYSGSVWSDRLPRLLQARLVQALADSGKFAAVGGSSDRLDSDLALTTEIRAFQIEVNQSVATAFILLYMKLVDDNGRVIAAQGFSERIPAIKNDPQSGVESLNEGLQNVLNRVVQWAGQVQYRHLSRKN